MFYVVCVKSDHYRRGLHVADVVARSRSGFYLVIVGRDRGVRMSTRDAVGSSESFWDMIEGRRPFSPSSELLGLKILSIDAEAGTMETQFEATPQFLNAGGTVQGGFITAMLDDTVSYAGIVHLKGTHALPTLEIKTSFMRPAFVGSLFGTGKLVHRGRDFAFLEGSLRDKDAKLIATATASARIVAIEELRARLVGKEALRKAS